MSSTIKVKVSLSTLMNLISATIGDVPFVVAGGFVRDLVHGVECNDIDVWIADDDYEAVVDHLEFNNVLFNELHTYEEATDSSFSDRVDAVIELDGIDLVFVKHPIKEVCEYFDFNINQYMLKKEVMFGCLEGNFWEPCYVGKSEQGVLERRRETTSERTEKICALAEEYGWKVPDGINA